MRLVHNCFLLQIGYFAPWANALAYSCQELVAELTSRKSDIRLMGPLGLNLVNFSFAIEEPLTSKGSGNLVMDN